MQKIVKTSSGKPEKGFYKRNEIIYTLFMAFNLNSYCTPVIFFLICRALKLEEQFKRNFTTGT